MIIYYSGDGGAASGPLKNEPEVIVPPANVMLSYNPIREKSYQKKRFGLILEQRKRGDSLKSTTAGRQG